MLSDHRVNTALYSKTLMTAASMKKPKAQEQIPAAPQLDEFGFVEPAAPAPTEPHVPIRERFPPAGSDYMSGCSDGWEYRTVFAGTKLVYTYEMVKQFLQEEGYGNIPIPETVEDLRLFKRPRSKQLQLFSEHGYVHNPLKIMFPENPQQRNTLVLYLYNEQAEGHLLRFHGVVK